jgi:hypothetical protein
MLLFATLPLGPKRYYNNQNLMQQLKHILNVHMGFHQSMRQGAGFALHGQSSLRCSVFPANH